MAKAFDDVLHKHGETPVSTPSRHSDGHADLSYVHAGAKGITDTLEGFTVIVNKSIVPVGTGDEVERIIRDAPPDADFAVVSTPKFLREGAAINDFKRLDRVVIGGDDACGLEVIREIYRPLAIGRTPTIEISRRMAALTMTCSPSCYRSDVESVGVMLEG